MIHKIVLLCCAALVGNSEELPADHQWPQWRGPHGNGVAPHADPPLQWTENRNILWKLALPGHGLSTPVVWGERLFVTTAVPFGEAIHVAETHADGAHDNLDPTHRLHFVVLAINRRDGRILWQKTVRDEQPHEGAHVTASWASPSPVTDGKRLYVSFGSRGIYCLDLDGKLLWEKDFGDMQIRHEHGEGSSPALYGNTLIVNWDHQGASFLAALDSRTGEQRWQVARDEITSWSTPLVVEVAGKPQVIVSASRRVCGYDLSDGKLIWECAGLSRNVVASPVAADGMVYVANSYDWQAMMAIRLADAKGDITASPAVVWTLDRHTPYVPSPLLYDGKLYFIRHSQGFLSCLDAKTGKPFYGPQRLKVISDLFASPLGAAGRIYLAGRGGTVLVLKAGPTFQVLAQNELPDSFTASPLAVDKALYLRGKRFLYCIQRDEPGK